MSNRLDELKENVQNLLDAQTKLQEVIKKCDEEIEFGAIAEDEQMIKDAEAKKAENEQSLKKVEEQIEMLQKIIDNMSKREEREAEIINELSEKYPAQYDMYRIMTMSDEEAQAAIANMPEQSQELTNSLGQEKAELSQKLESTNSRLQQIESEINQIKAEFMETHDMSLKDKLMNTMNEKKELEASKTQQEAKFAEISNQPEVNIPQKMTVEEYKNNKKKELAGKYIINKSRDHMNSFIENQENLGYTPEQIVAKLNEETKIISEQRYALWQTAEDQRYKDARDIISAVTRTNGVCSVRDSSLNEMENIIDRIIEKQDTSEAVKNTLTELKAKIEKCEESQQAYSESNQNEELAEKRNASCDDAQKLVWELSVESFNTIKNIQEEKLGYSLLTSPDEKHSFDGLNRDTPENIQAYNKMSEKIRDDSTYLIAHIEENREIMKREQSALNVVPYIRCMNTVTDSKPGHYTVEDLEKYEVSDKFFKNEFQRALNDSNQAKKAIVESQEIKLQPIVEEKQDNAELSRMMQEAQQTTTVQNQVGTTYQM